MRRLTQLEFIEKANKIHNNTYDYSLTFYETSRTKIKIICFLHGEFTQTANSHLAGQGCPECGKNKASESKKLSTQEFLEKAYSVHGNTYSYINTKYIEATKKITITCKKHGDFLIAPFHHLSGSGCKICNGGSSYTTEDFIKKSIDIYGNLYDYSKVNYIDKETHVIIVCNKHGEFSQKPHNHVCGYGCPKCSHSKSQTKLYNKLLKSFEGINILAEQSPLWLNKQRFDIYFPKYNIAVEYNGEQHYIPVPKFGGELEFEKTKERDVLKREKCRSNKCILFEVKYDYTKNDYETLVNNIQTIIKLKENESQT